jgi:hypothetical protein
VFVKKCRILILECFGDLCRKGLEIGETSGNDGGGRVWAGGGSGCKRGSVFNAGRRRQREAGLNRACPDAGGDQEEEKEKVERPDFHVLASPFVEARLRRVLAGAGSTHEQKQVLRNYTKSFSFIAFYLNSFSRFSTGQVLVEGFSDTNFTNSR